MDERVAELINEFESLSRDHAGPVPFSLRFGEGEPHLLVTAAIHGNETGGIPPMVEVAKELAGDRIRFGGTVTLAIGNLEAIKVNQRYIEEDLNRAFKDWIEGDNYEQMRAIQLVQLIDECDHYIDLHQTMSPTVGPFYIVENSERGVDFAQAIAASDKVIVIDHETTEKDAYNTSLSYATNNGKVGFVIELSKMGLNKKGEITADRCIRKAIDLLAKGTHSVVETSLSEKDLRRMKIVGKVDVNDPNDKLKKGLVNLAQVKKDEVVGERADGEKIKVPQDGFILFPKYLDDFPSTVEPPKDLFLILKDA